MNWYAVALMREAAASIPEISEHVANEQRLFGPVWHGTTHREEIEQSGFQVPVGEARTEGVSHGYEKSDYHGGTPAPIHHLGFGTYFTTVKAIAGSFGYGSSGPAYYLNVPRLETINFGVPSTMMKWWTTNGYDPKIAVVDRVLATQMLTNTLKQRFDAVWFKGKGIRRLLDGDQICVFEPNGRVFQLNKKLAQAARLERKSAANQME